MVAARQDPMAAVTSSGRRSVLLFCSVERLRGRRASCQSRLSDVVAATTFDRPDRTVRSSLAVMY